MNLYGKRRIADATIEKEEKRLQEEMKLAEKFKEKIKQENGDIK